MELKALLQEMIDKKASDVFIVAGLPLTYTADGDGRVIAYTAVFLEEAGQ